jgi:hypothetical protein
MPKPLLPRTDSNASLSSNLSSNKSHATGSGSTSSNAPTYFDLDISSETTHLGAMDQALSLLNTQNLGKTDEHSLYVHLYHVVGKVKAARPRMWEELKEMVQKQDESLVRYGWKQHEYTEEASKHKFEQLWDRFWLYVFLFLRRVDSTTNV